MMTPRATLVLAALGLAACGVPDPCALETGTCLEIDVQGGLGPDALVFRLTGALRHRFTRELPGRALPAAVPVVLPPSVVGMVTVEAAATTAGETIGWGQAQATLAMGGRSRVTVTLAPATAACDNGRWDAREADLDCAGPCAPCGVGKSCIEDAECLTQACESGRCVDGPLMIAGVSPPRAPSSGDTRLTIQGTGFEVGAQVTIDGRPATDVQVRDGTRITATAPPAPGRHGLVEVKVDLGKGRTATASDVFGYYPAELLLQGPLAVPLLPNQHATQVLAADLFGDARAERALLFPDANLVLVQSGDPMIRSSTLDTPIVPSVIAAGQLGGTGRDLLVGTAQGTLLIFRQGSPGSFAATPPLSGPLPTAIAQLEVVDLEGDQFPDVVARLASNTIEVFRNTNGTFSSGVALAGPPAVAAMAAGQLASDGLPALAVATGTLTQVWATNASGLVMLARTLTEAGQVIDVAVGDLNQDMADDIVALTLNAAQTVCLHPMGESTGTTCQPAYVTPKSRLLLADLTGDGKPDVVVTSPEGPTQIFPVTNGLLTRGFVINVAGLGNMGDVDGDGRPDLVTLIADNEPADLVAFTIMTPMGPFASFTIPPPAGGASEVSGVAAGDLTGDGKADLIVARAQLERIEVYQGRGDGGFSDVIPVKVASGPKSLLLDGADLLVPCWDAGALVVVPRAVPGATPAPLLPIPTGGHPTAVVAGDFNGDGNRDFAVAQDNGVAVRLGPDGAFAPLLEGEEAAAIVAGDFNKDGRTDVAVSTRRQDGSSGVSVLLGQKSSSTPLTQSGTTFVVQGAPAALTVADLDGDGVLDLIVSPQNEPAQIRKGQGQGTFAAPAVPSPGVTRLSMLPVDLDVDGRIDLVSVTLARVGVLHHEPSGGYTEKQVIPLAWLGGDGISGVAAADFNGDGLPDLAFAMGTAGTRGVILNASR